MRKEFSAWLKAKLEQDSKAVFLTGDLGFQAFEEVQATFKDRFVNVGVAEQNMILLAAGLASEGLMPICYSIAPFAVFRPYEQSRLNLGIHHLKAMIVGNGGGYGYGIMGATHHALEDIAAISSLPHFKCFVPVSNEDLAGVADQAYLYNGPSYLRMGFGNLPASRFPETYSSIRKFASGDQFTILALGPVTLNALQGIENAKIESDVFAISEAPITELSKEFIQSVQKTKKLLIIEEHSVRGGIGEMVTYLLAKTGVSYQLHHRYALGYPNKKYGNQSYHQQLSGLDSESLARLVTEASRA